MFIFILYPCHRKCANINIKTQNINLNHSEMSSYSNTTLVLRHKSIQIF